MSERYPWPVSTAYAADFYVFNSSGAAVAGLTNGDFGKILKKNGVVNAVAVTVTEHVAADGGYRAAYTPDATGNWSLWVTQATHNTRGWQDDLQVYAEEVLAGSKQTGDSFARIGVAGAGLTALGDARIANLDATVSSRLASASYSAPLDAAGTRTAVGLAAANLDTQLAAIDDFLDTEVAAIKAKTDNLPASPAAVGSAMTLTSGERDSIAAALLDLADAIETSLTVRKALRAIAAEAAGDVTGGPDVPAFKGAGVATTRLTSTADEDGNRTVVLNL